MLKECNKSLVYCCCFFLQKNNNNLQSCVCDNKNYLCRYLVSNLTTNSTEKERILERARSKSFLLGERKKIVIGYLRRYYSQTLRKYFPPRCSPPCRYFRVKCRCFENFNFECHNCANVNKRYPLVLADTRDYKLLAKSLHFSTFQFCYFNPDDIFFSSFPLFFPKYR